jgi:hypothetical protein
VRVDVPRRGDLRLRSFAVIPSSSSELHLFPERKIPLDPPFAKGEVLPPQESSVMEI